MSSQAVEVSSAAVLKKKSREGSFDINAGRIQNCRLTIPTIKHKMRTEILTEVYNG